MKTELLVELYDVKTHSFVKEFDISSYNLAKINEICLPEDEGDFEYIESKFVEENEFKKLKIYISELSNYNYDDFIYNIITRSV
jgi:hypothetical protein